MMEAASLTARLSPHLTCRGLSLRRTKIPAMTMTSLRLSQALDRVASVRTSGLPCE